MTHYLGIPDEEFIRGAIPMTKQEIRMMILAKARIAPADIVIDIGAGTGSLSVEAALLADRGQVYAIERNAEGIDLIKLNANKFKVANIEIIHGTAPEALKELPVADVILLGGSGGQLQAILERGQELLKAGGRFIISAVTLETLAGTMAYVSNNADFTVEAFGLQVTRINQVAAYNMFQSLNQIYIIVCTKKERG